VRTRYCPNCDDEFRPDIVRCSDCGGELVDRDDEDAMTDAAEPDPGEAEPELPAGELRSVFTCVDATSLKEAAALLGGAGIPFRATGDATGFRVLVLPAYQSAALSVLHGSEPDAAEADAAEQGQGGPCPACGVAVPAGAAECPECGLALAGEPEDAGKPEGGPEDGS